jgi:hypothetical protein
VNVIDDFSNAHGWALGVRVVKGGGCKSGDPDCFCSERTGIDAGELWAVVNVYDIDCFDEDDTRPPVIACGCRTREKADRDASEWRW